VSYWQPMICFLCFWDKVPRRLTVIEIAIAIQRQIVKIRKIEVDENIIIIIKMTNRRRGKSRKSTGNS